MSQSPASNIRRGMEAIFAAADRERVWLAFVVALTVGCVIYRLELVTAIYFSGEQANGLPVAPLPLVDFPRMFLSDLLVVSLGALAYLVVKLRLRAQAPRLVASKIFLAVEAATAILILMGLALISCAHYQLFVQLETGLTMTFVQMMPEMLGPRDFFHLFAPQDIIFIAAQVVIFLMALGSGQWLRRIYQLAALVGVLVILLAQLFPMVRQLPREATLNPLSYLFDDAMTDALNIYFHRQDAYRDVRDLPGEPQLNSIHLVHPAFTTGSNRPPAPRLQHALTADGKPWNVLFFVLESTGADYIFDRSLGNPTPMPFLQQLIHEGLYLTNHFASANNSAHAAFSIFTGLYPRPTHEIFAMEPSVKIPTLNRYLGNDYHFLLIHPTDASYSFPAALFLNNGLREFDSKENLPPGNREDVSLLARNEIDVMDFLQQRLKRVREPFLAVYWSFIPHFPYTDYGPEYRILPGLQNKQQLYYNNLRTLDLQIQRVFDHLVQTGMADRTLFVFVGDHGEAFGQHQGIWTHSFGSYSEMYRVPMLFWQPKLIPPQTVKFPTSHVDITPTLLDLLGVSYDESRFQGESAVRGTPARKYIFTMDARANHLGSISAQMNKAALALDDNTADDYNLAKDPKEKFPLNEARYPEQINALLKFRNYQTDLVGRYNDALLAGQKFPP